MRNLNTDFKLFFRLQGKKFLYGVYDLSLNE